jgi:hypothetical protein
MMPRSHLVLVTGVGVGRGGWIVTYPRALCRPRLPGTSGR